MKSEHRHELETNSLASSVATLPDTLKKHSSKILTVLAIALLVVAAVWYKRNQDEIALMNVRESLASAWNGISRLQLSLMQLNSMRQRLPAELINPEIQKLLDTAEADVKASVQSVIDASDASDKAQLASAYSALGQLYWVISTSAPLPDWGSVPTTQSATQPATQTTTRPTNYLDLSRDAYPKIVNDYSDQSAAVVTARFALAAIAENKQDWKGARDYYKTIIESTDLPAPDKVMAERRIAEVEKFEKPLLLLPASQPVELPPLDEPTTAPSLTDLPSLDMGPVSPSSQPATAPTTQP